MTQEPQAQAPQRAVRLAAVVLRLLAAVTAAVTPAMAEPRVDLYQRLGDMHHTAWTAKDGLIGIPDCLAQTADGYLWIGTNNGLYRFDGVAFERYQPEAGALTAVAVSSLLATRDGGLWVGYASGGADFISRDGRVTSYTADSGLPISTVRDLAEDHEGVVWVATVGGLARLEKGRWQRVRTDWNYPCRSAWLLHVERDGTLWVGGASPNKILFLPKGAKRFHDAGLDTQALAFVQIGEGKLLVAASPVMQVHEIQREPDGAATSRPLMALSSQGMAVDRYGGVWFAGFSIDKLRMEHLSTLRPQPTPPLDLLEPPSKESPLSGAIASDVLIDREDNVWVTTEKGLDRFRRRNLSWKSDPHLVNGAGLVADPSGQAWVLAYLAPTIKRVQDAMPVKDAPPLVRAGFPGEGAVWLNAEKQFVRWSGGRFEQVPPPAEVVERGYAFNVPAAVTDRSGRLWAAVGGIGQFYRQNDQWTFVPILPDRPNWTASRAHADAANRVWLAYVNELAMVDNGRVRLFTKADGLDVGFIQSIGSRAPEVWVGGERGLALLQGGRFHPVRTSPRGDLGAVSGIVPTRDGLWLATASDIVHIPEQEARRLAGDPTARVRVGVFDLVSDLPDPLGNLNGVATSVVQDGADVLWFVTRAGLARVDPRQIVRNTAPPPVLIRAVTADDKAYPIRGAVSLPALTRNLRIDYTALSLSIPERVRFRYRLDGWDTDWHEAGTRRTVFYTDLRPGRYTLRVLACNNDDVWNEVGAALSFTVAPAWYQTAWWQSGAWTAAIGSVLVIYRNRLRRASAALSARFEDRLAERTRIARDLHDTLLQTVQSSKMLADEALAAPPNPTQMRKDVEQLSEWLGLAVKEGRAALNSLRVSASDTADLAAAFESAAEDPTRPASMEVSVAVHGASRELHPIVRDEIYRIGYEAMRNAYVHSKATRLDVVLSYTPDFMLRIIDNGVGLDPAIVGAGKRGHFGLPGMRERATNIGGTLTIDSSATGTRITLVMPCPEA